MLRRPETSDSRGEAGSQKAGEAAEGVRFHSRDSLRTRSVQRAGSRVRPASSLASGVDQFAVRAAYTVTKAPELIPDL